MCCIQSVVTLSYPEWPQDPNQPIFKAALSRVTSLVAVTENHQAIRSKQTSMVLILPDLSIAFDTVNHKTLLSILLELVSQHSLLLSWMDSHIRWYEGYLLHADSLPVSHKVYCLVHFCSSGTLGLFAW